MVRLCFLDFSGKEMIMNKYKPTIRIHFLYLFTIIFFVLGAVLALCRALTISIIFLVIGVICGSVAIVKTRKQLFSFSIVFWLFSALYALCIPITIAMGGELDATFHAGNMEENVFPFLVGYSLSGIGFICAQGSINDYNEENSNYQLVRDTKIDLKIVEHGMVLTAFLTTLFELINLMRVGGFLMLFVGKGVYQSAVGDLFLTLPSEVMYSICGAFIGLYLGCQKKNQRTCIQRALIMTIIFLAPFLLCKIILGQRGVLISSVLSGLSTYTAFCPIKKIQPKMIVLAAVAYVFLMFLYTNRGIVSLLLENPEVFWEKALDFERLKQNLNPGDSEFGASFGNFCMFYEKYGIDYDYKFGLTYLQGLVVPIPSFLYIGTKPTQITYAFRDEFFSSWANRSRIASTGFSSILEAYINGGFLGILFVYFVVGIILKKIEKRYRSSDDVLAMIMFSGVVSSCMSFSRSAFGTIFSTICWYIIYCFILYFILTHVKIYK